MSSDPNLDMLPPALRMAATSKSRTPASPGRLRTRTKSMMVRKEQTDALAKIRCQPRDDLLTEDQRRKATLNRRQNAKVRREEEEAIRLAQAQSDAVMTVIHPPAIHQQQLQEHEHEQQQDESLKHAKVRSSWERTSSSPIMSPSGRVIQQAIDDPEVLKNQLRDLPLDNSHPSTTTTTNTNNNKKESHHSMAILKKKLEKVEMLLSQETTPGTKEYKKLNRKKEQYQMELAELKAEATATAATTVVKVEKKEKEEGESTMQQEARQLHERAAALKAKRSAAVDDATSLSVDVHEEKERLKQQQQQHLLDEYRLQQKETKDAEAAATAKAERTKEFRILKKKLQKLDGMILAAEADADGKDAPAKLYKKQTEYLSLLEGFDEWETERQSRAAAVIKEAAEEVERCRIKEQNEARAANKVAQEETQKRRQAEVDAERQRKRTEEAGIAAAEAAEEAQQKKEEEAAERQRQKMEEARLAAADAADEQSRREAKKEAEEEADERQRQKTEESRIATAEGAAEQSQREAEKEAEEVAEQQQQQQKQEERLLAETKRLKTEEEAKQKQREEDETLQKQLAQEEAASAVAAVTDEEEDDEDEDEELDDEEYEEELRRQEEAELEQFLWQQEEAKKRSDEKKERAKKEAEERSHREAEEATQKVEQERVDEERRKQEEEEAAKRAQEPKRVPPKAAASQEFLDLRAIPEPHSANTKKILNELEGVEERQARLEKTLKQHGIAVIEDIPYELAKEKIAELQEQMKELAASTDDQFGVQKKYYALEEEMSKYFNAMMLTDEFAEEQRQAEEKWEASVEADNIIALRKLRSHMPVNIRNMSEDQLTTETSPNGKSLPKAFAKKFKRTNVLQLLRVNPIDLERMHPSLIEGLRSTGLTLTERRALHEHLKDVGIKWQELQQDPSIQRKFSWLLSLKSKFKEMANAYDKHVKEHGPRDNHPYAKRNDPGGGGCPMIGNQCPVKADGTISYDEDYGYTQETVYEKSEAAKTSIGDSNHSKTPTKSKSMPKARPSAAPGKAKDEALMVAINERLHLADPESSIDTKLIRELFHAEKRAVNIAKQLAQNNIALPKEDIPFAVAKTKVAEITEEIKIVASKMGSTLDMKEMAQLEKEYSRLSDDLEKYNNALMLTKEWALELIEKEQQWEESVRPENAEALRNIRQHMPVNIKDLSEQDMTQGATPNGKHLPQKTVRKFKRTNILQLLRMPPAMIEPMHPSSLESMRSTGLTLTERRALHEHLKDLGAKWKKSANDKMSERKWMWHESLRGKFKEIVGKYQAHVDQYGPPENHPYVKRGEEASGGCPLLGKQCPLKADAEVDYSVDYGFPAEAIYNVEQVKKSNLLTVEDIERRKQEGDDWVNESKCKQQESEVSRPPTIGFMSAIGSQSGGDVPDATPPKIAGGLMASIATKGGNDLLDKPKAGGGLMAAIQANASDKPKAGGGLMAAIQATAGNETKLSPEPAPELAPELAPEPAPATPKKRRGGGGLLAAITGRKKK